MPSVKEIYHKIDDVRIEADSINLNVDGLEALASTQQADIADIKADLANGVTINQPVAVTDNNGSLTVDGTVTANVGIASESDVTQFGEWIANGFSAAQPTIAVIGTSSGQPFPISGTVTANVEDPNNTITAQIENYASNYSTAFPVDIINQSGGLINVTDKGSNGQATVGTFNSTTSATLASSDATRKLLTIFNEGAGNLHILYGSGTASTTNYSVRLSAGDYLEIEKYTGDVTAIFATAGTARVTGIT